MDTDDYRVSEDEPDDLDDQDEPSNEIVDTRGAELVERTSRRDIRTAGSSERPTQSRAKSRSENSSSQNRNSEETVQKQEIWIKKNAKHANAFINFVQEFKKENPQTMTGKNIFRICGERWKNMTDEQKQPYIAAANTVKRLKQLKQSENSEHPKKSVTRVSKRKADTKRKETFRKRSKVLEQDVFSNSDTDTATTVHSSLSDADSF